MIRLLFLGSHCTYVPLEILVGHTFLTSSNVTYSNQITLFLHTNFAALIWRSARFSVALVQNNSQNTQLFDNTSKGSKITTEIYIIIITIHNCTTNRKRAGMFAVDSCVGNWVGWARRNRLSKPALIAPFGVIRGIGNTFEMMLLCVCLGVVTYRSSLFWICYSVSGRQSDKGLAEPREIIACSFKLYGRR